LQFQNFLQELEKRHLADLRFSEVTRALRALSSAYVERRETALADHKALDGAGKRAAFALYYGPIHFLLVQHIVRELGVTPDRGTVVDLGCGTGVAGAAVATAGSAGAEAPALHVLGIDTHPWTLDEARFTYKAFGLRFDVRRGHAARTRFPSDTSFVVAAFVVNEFNDADRAEMARRLQAAATSVLIIEPISNRISPWWHEWVDALGAQAHEWKIRVEAPPIVKKLAKAAGLRPEVLTARSLFVVKR
jgi:ubiquinone/menaquinone biosynthesis C-methylase UbiE